jgi:BirA family biotin operon repressor/biotin-[acetyl-CoA-carboxylase] ligase
LNAPLFADAAEASRWSRELPEGCFGRERLDYAAAVDSTQDLAFEAARAGAAAGSVFVADEQTAGRGRQGARWQAAPCSSLLLSVLLGSEVRPEDSGRASLRAALGACRAAEKTLAVDPAIKWPNDMLLAGRKFGGILIENRAGAGVLGVGLNVLQRPEDFPPELAEGATSLAAQIGTVPDRRWLLAMLLVEITGLFGPVPQPWESVRAEVARRLAWRGRPVRIGEVRGVLTGVDETGRLVLEADGRPLAVASGSLELDEA